MRRTIDGKIINIQWISDYTATNNALKSMTDLLNLIIVLIPCKCVTIYVHIFAMEDIISFCDIDFQMTCKISYKLGKIEVISNKDIFTPDLGDKILEIYDGFSYNYNIKSIGDF